MFLSTFLALLLPLLIHTPLAAANVFCPECGINGIFYTDPGCTNATYVAPLFGGDAGECFEIGAPYSPTLQEVAHMPFGQQWLTKSVLVDFEQDNCEVFFYSGLSCQTGTSTKVNLGECASDNTGWGSFCVSCPAGSSVYGAGESCPT